MYKDFLVQGDFWSTLLYYMSFPYINIWIMKQLDNKYVAVQNIIVCVATVLISTLWNKKSNKLYKFYSIFMFSECAVYLVLYSFVIFGNLNGRLYYLIDTILFSLITKNIICGTNKLKSIIYKNEKREKYDNTSSIAAAIASIVGSILSIALNIPIEIAFAIGWAGISIDNLFYYLAYRKYKESDNIDDKGI